jgi:hypothetical protein
MYLPCSCPLQFENYLNNTWSGVIRIRGISRLTIITRSPILNHRIAAHPSLTGANAIALREPRAHNLIARRFPTTGPVAQTDVVGCSSAAVVAAAAWHYCLSTHASRRYAGAGIALNRSACNIGALCDAHAGAIETYIEGCVQPITASCVVDLIIILTHACCRITAPIGLTLQSLARSSRTQVGLAYTDSCLTLVAHSPAATIVASRPIGLCNVIAGTC